MSDRALSIIFALLIAALVFLTAYAAKADDRYTWHDQSGHPSIIVLQPTDAPGAVAEVIFDNRPIHARDENLSMDLTANGLTVTVTAYVGRGMTPDRIEVFPPPGFFALPASIDVAESDVGRVLIYAGEGLGM